MIETPSLVDQYCHGVLRTELGLGTFEAQLARSEGPPAAGTTFFDTQTGFAVRRWCPPLLGLEPHCTPARYLARRRELGVLESGRRLLRGSGITTYLVDTGLPGDLTGPDEMASTGNADAHEIVRLELLAEQVADTSGTVESFLANLAESVHAAAAGAVAFASVAGVRHGLALAPEPPGPGEVRGAAGRWLAHRPVGGSLTDPVLLRHLLWIAVASGRPLQLHAGLGRVAKVPPAPRRLAHSPALGFARAGGIPAAGPGESPSTSRTGASARHTGSTLPHSRLPSSGETPMTPQGPHSGWTTGLPRYALDAPTPRIDHTDPVLLTDFARATAGLGTDLVLLHGYPYHRHAAHLAAAFPHVYADLGAELVRTGARATGVLAEVLELAPFGKLLFSSGAGGLPELHVVGARLFREALARVLGTWVAEGAWSLADAQRVAGLIAAGNARRVYGLE